MRDRPAASREAPRPGPRPSLSSADRFDVVVVGGGPAGAVTAWALARQGVRVAVLDRAEFPRDKVCGDYVEPAGLRILGQVGCLEALRAQGPVAITGTRIVVDGETVFRGEVPYYHQDDAGTDPMPAHALILPRRDLDAAILRSAEAAGAQVRTGCTVRHLERDGGGVRVEYLTRADRRSPRCVRAPLVIGADGTESVVARCLGTPAHDLRHLYVSQRGYLEGVSVAPGEATVWFDREGYPGYGWLFPMPAGRANVGIGTSSLVARRFGLSVPELFQRFVRRLRARHPGCSRAELEGRASGGVCRTYGGIRRNHHDRTLLVGDAGAFIDPVTGEGITPGMEAGLLAAGTALEALSAGRFDAAFLARYEHAFRTRFDPSMAYLEFCATLLRNRHFAEFWMRAARHGFRAARSDAAFARVSGATFGGVDVRPGSILFQMTERMFAHALDGGIELWRDLLAGRPAGGVLAGDLAAWSRGLAASLRDDPAEHLRWTLEVLRKGGRLGRFVRPGPSPRVHGVPVSAPS